MVPREGPTPPPLMVDPLAPLGFCPTWGVLGGGNPSLAFIRRGWGAFFLHNIDLSLSPFSFLERFPLVWSLHWVGGFSTIRMPSCYWNLDSNPSSFRCSPDSEPVGNVGYIVCV